VLWLTDGFAETSNGKSERVGLARVRVNGQYPTVLKQQRFELAWTVRLETSVDPKFGPTKIEISPGPSDPERCFGTLYDLCTFKPKDFVASRNFQAQEICSAGRPDPTVEKQ
jgi:hypothetical protein